MAKRLLKICAFLVSGFFLLVLLLLVLIQTRPFKTWLADFASHAVNKKINAELSIGKITGNYFTHLELFDTVVMYEADTLAYIPHLALEYKPRDIIHQKITVSKILIESPSFHLFQFPDSSWVFEHIAQNDSTPKPKNSQSASTDTSASRWTIDVQHLNIENSQARIAALDSLIPNRITNLNLALAARLAPDEKTLALQHFDFQTKEPDFHLRSLSFVLEQQADELRLQQFALNTAYNKVQIDGNVMTEKPLSGDAHISTAPISMSEFHFVLPSIEFKGQPVINLATYLKNDTLSATLRVTSEKSKVELNAGIQNFSSLLNKETDPEPRYQADASFHNIHLSDWAPDIQNKIVVNGTLSANGKGRSVETASAAATIQLADCRFDDSHIKSLNFTSTLESGNAKANIDLASDMGRLHVKANVRQFMQLANIDASLSGRDINLEPILSDSALSSNLNFDIDISGESMKNPDRQAHLFLQVHPSQFADVMLDTGFADVDLENNEILLNTLNLQHPEIHVRASGQINPSTDSDLNIDLQAFGFDVLKPYIAADSLSGSVNVTSRIQGKLDSLHITGTVDADSLQYNAFFIDSVLVNLDAKRQQNQFTGTVQANVNAIDLGQIALNSLELDVALEPDHIDLKTRLRQKDDVQATAHVQYFLNELPMLFIKQLDVDAFDRHWSGGSDSTTIMLGDGEYIVTNMLIEYREADTTSAQIYADGIVRLNGEQNFSVKIEKYNLAGLTMFLEQQPNINGDLDLQVSLTGPAEAPQLVLNTELTHLEYESYQLERLKANITYSDNQIAPRVSLYSEQDSLTMTGTIPANFSLRDQSFSIQRQQPFNLAIKSSELPIASLIPANIGLEKVSGAAVVDIRAGNTLADITPGGSISLRNASFRYPEFAAGLDEFNVELAITQDSLLLRQFSGRNGKGFLKLDGFAALDRSIFSGVLKALSLNLVADKFYVSRKPEHEIQVNANINVNGAMDSLRYDGFLDILRSSFYLPALTKNRAQAQTHRQPLLLKSLATAIDSSQTDTTIVVQVRQEPSSVLKNITGKLDLRFPRNTWIKSDNMRVELNGDIDIIKNSDYFEIFGPITILRGQYDFLGRRFKLTEGTASFQGGQEINPMLNVNAEYTFRDPQRRKRTITLNVTDEALTPNIQFKLDDQAITEGEAVSYILFNRSPDEISNQQNGSTASEGYKAEDLVYGLASAELSKRVGQQLGVDYLEVKGKSSTSTAGFVVGKYITPNLFMSYEQYIGALEEDQAPRILTVEYELTKYLFLQLISGDTKSSGADILIRFDHE